MLKRMFSLDDLMNDWKTGQYNEDASFKYIIAFLILQSFQSFSSRSSTTPPSEWVVFFTALFMLIIAIVLFRILWDANGGNEGNRFLDKWLSLTVVLTVTRAIPIVLVIVAYMFLPVLLNTPSFAAFTALSGLAALLALAAYIYVRILRLLKDIRAAELRNPTVGTTSV